MTNHEHHIELWDFCIEHPELEKGDWDKWEEVKQDHPIAYENECFACEETDAIDKHTCMGCPIDWGDEEEGCMGESLYSKWRNERNLQTRSDLATQIRDAWRIE
jgi:hypothetical protein